ncbi:hypothetical protein [Vibrio caribbeanicus]|uniref:hypothetical protein n=1 Tax=Vibrio caribbeanicus TaxID=701175 RepID=UPI0022842EFC|nr:hypothetical protein [Vibrio caribbeanicus]MCY9842914.1 hypothetical protein [Vibrio caribbeanicus]
MTNLSLQSVPLCLLFLLLALAGCGDEITKSNDREESDVPATSPSGPIPVGPSLEMSSVNFLSVDHVSHGELKLTWQKVDNATTYRWCFETPAPIRAQQCHTVVPTIDSGNLLTTTINQGGALKLHDYAFFIEASNSTGTKPSNSIKLIDHPDDLDQMIGYLKSPTPRARYRFGSEVLLNHSGNQLFVKDEDSVRIFEKQAHEWKFLPPVIPIATGLDKRLLSTSSSDDVLAVISDRDEVIIYKKSNNNSWNVMGSPSISSISEINSISLSGNGDYVLVGTEGNGTDVFGLAIPTPSIINHPTDFVDGVAFLGSTSTEQFVVIYEDNHQTRLSLFEGATLISDFQYVSYLRQHGINRLSLDFSEDGTTLVIGLPYFNRKEGLVLVYKGDNMTELLGSKPEVLTATNKSQHSLFGFSVAVSKDGRKVLVGAPYESSDHAGIYEGGGRAIAASGRLVASGAAYLFEERGGFYHQLDFIKSPSPRSKEHFGYSVTMDANGEFIAVGAPGESIGAAGFNQLSLDERKNSQTSSNSSEVGAVFLY